MRVFGWVTCLVLFEGVGVAFMDDWWLDLLAAGYVAVAWVWCVVFGGCLVWVWV